MDFGEQTFSSDARSFKERQLENCRDVVGLISAVQRGDDEAFTLLWRKNRSAQDWKELSEESLAMLWEMFNLSTGGGSFEELGELARQWCTWQFERLSEAEIAGEGFHGLRQQLQANARRDRT